MARLLRALKALPPVVAITQFVGSHARAAAWLGLSAGICAVLAVGGRNVDLPLRSWLALFAAGVLTAGLCIWIVSAGDED